MARYTVFLNDTLGNRLEDISAFNQLDYQRIENNVGEMKCIVPATFDRRLLTVDARIEVLRTNADGRSNRDGDTIWLLQDWIEVYIGRDKYYQLTANDANHLLDRRYIPYAAGTSYATKSTYADDMLKAIMRENYGSLAKLPTEVPPATADTARDLSAYLAIQANTSKAPSIIQSFANSKILEVLNQVTNASGQAGTELFFDIFAIDAKTLEFRTYTQYRNADRRLPNGDVTFSPQNGTLFNAKVTTQYSSEVNAIYAKGQGSGSERNANMVVVTDTARIAKSPLNRREGMVNNSKSELTALQYDANAALYAGKPKIILDAELRDTDNAQYNVAWAFGDYIPVSIGEYNFNAHIRAVQVSVKDNKETIKAVVRSVI